MNSYAELHVHSCYSFLDGASFPEEIIDRAIELGLSGVALTDHDGLPGIVRFARHAKKSGMPTIFGSEITLGEYYCSSKTSEEVKPSEVRTDVEDPRGKHLLVLARDADGYRRLSRSLSHGKLKSERKGSAVFTLEELAEAGNGHWQILTGCRKGILRSALESEPGRWNMKAAQREIDTLVALFGRENIAIELENNSLPLDRTRNSVLLELAHSNQTRVVASNNVHAASPQGKQLADVLSAVRSGKALQEIEPWLQPWGGFMKSLPQMEMLYEDNKDAVYNAGIIATECAFDLALVEPNLPPYAVPQGYTEDSWLKHVVEEQGVQRYGLREDSEYSRRAWEQIDHELEVITELNFSGYFLIVYDIVEFCRRSGILCQGRGSAANSAVCFALGITAVDSVKHRMLFERFLSPDRLEPPDIDLDIEARERERVIQYVYNRYGREHAAQVANIITYRKKSALRDAGKALGYSERLLNRWSKNLYRGGKSNQDIPPSVMKLAESMKDLPRYRGIHSGGMILCDRPIIDVCPVEWASKEGRSVVQWDKDDCADAGLVKFDLLGLGMLTALKIAFDALAATGVRSSSGAELGLHNLPDDDPRVYDLLCAADTVGVFQVESRAQMSTLPRIRPRTFYDIVIEVALIRPGPIQGGSVNPYIQRRRGEEPVTYLHPLLHDALEKTLGIPLFQEQLMRIAMDAANFTPAQADKLRKAMGSKRSHREMTQLKSELMAGMRKNGIDEATSEEIYTKLEAFADFGFPESHAFSFAYLVYASAWLKVNYPEYFYASLLAAQPMGFYSPRTLIQDAKWHGVKVLPIDVNYSGMHSIVENVDEERTQYTSPIPDEHQHNVEHSHRINTHGNSEKVLGAHRSRLVMADRSKAIRLGLTNLKNFSHYAIERIVSERHKGIFRDVADLVERCRLTQHQVEVLARADALQSLDTSMQSGVWEAYEVTLRGKEYGDCFQPVIPGIEVTSTAPKLPELSSLEVLNNDLRAGVSIRHHVIEEFRDRLRSQGVACIADALMCNNGTRVTVAGVVTHRQRPRTAAGITFISLEDETGLANVVCSTGMWKVYGEIAVTNNVLIVRGMIEKAQGTVSIKADKIMAIPIHLPLSSRNFR